MGNSVWIMLLMLGLWVVSVRLRDASIVDVFWGMGFVLITWRTSLLAKGLAPRQFLIVSFTTLWGLRYSLYIFKRKRGKPEDPCYTAMRKEHGQRYWWVSLFTVGRTSEFRQRHQE